MTAIIKCPIWGEGYEATGYYDPSNRVFYVDDSRRAGGGYILPETMKHSMVDNLPADLKARLTTWLVNQRKQGNEKPTITEQVIRYSTNAPALQAHERAIRLLQFIAESAATIGERARINGNTHGTYAWSESTTWDEIAFLGHYLEERGWTSAYFFLDESFDCKVTVAGYDCIAEQTTNLDSSQAFIAMWFDGSMADPFEKGIRPAVEESGFNPMRIDQREHINKIDDEIIAEIRRSRFLVADFTHGEDGARGGVYYEAGFAHGLDIPVIFTCRKDAVDTLHFDTNHYNHIVWENPEDLREKLRNRILAVIGEGPGA